jgi:phenylacetate-CoA ligase
MDSNNSMRAKTKPTALPPTRSKSLRGMAERVRTADSASWVRLHSRNSLALFRDAAKRVPAYRDFLNEHGIQAEKVRTRKDFEKIPATSKATYLKKYPLGDLCWDGILGHPAVFSSTSGSTGKPFYFQRHQHLDEESSILSELFLANGEHLPGPKHPTLVIIGFGMGVWIGGTITYSAFDIASRRGYPVSILPAGVNKTEILKALHDLAPSFKQTILIGYPPFVKDILDEAEFEGVNLKALNIRLFFAAEAFTERFRDYLAEKVGIKNVYRDTLNVYGTTDLGTMAFETPTAILIRRLAMEHKHIFARIFGDAQKTPTLAQYNPAFVTFEASQGEILLTGNSAFPLIRYAVGDLGGVHTFAELKAIFAESGIDLEKEAKQRDVPLYELPFVYVYERSDFTVKLYGAIIFPEHVKIGLQNPAHEKFITGRFTMATESDARHNEYLEINVELKRGIKEAEPLRAALVESVVKSLSVSSGEYQNNHVNMGERVTPRIVFWPHEHPKYFTPGTKQKWVI